MQVLYKIHICSPNTPKTRKFQDIDNVKDILLDDKMILKVNQMDSKESH